MIRLPLSLLLVSLALGMDQSIDDRFTTTSNVSPDSALSNNFRHRRKQPYVEIREENAGRYFRRRPKTTTVSSIFSMKVENESQHVYPNRSPLDDLQVQPKQEEINVMDVSTPTQQQNYPPTTNSNNRRSNNVRRRVTYKRIRRPSSTTTPTVIIQQTEEITEQVVSSTTAAPIADTTEKEQEKVMVLTSNSNFSNEDSSLERPHPTISQIPEDLIQRMKETVEEVVISTSNAPDVTSTATDEPEKRVFTPSAHISHLIAFIKRHRPINVQTTANQEKEKNEQAIDSTTTLASSTLASSTLAPAPITVTIAAKTNDKSEVSPSESYVPNIVSTVRPKSRRTFRRGSLKYNRNDIKKDMYNEQGSNLDSNSTQLSSTTMKTPPPVPTLSPWYDGFGK